MKRHYFGLTLVFLVFGLIFVACSNADSATNPPTLPSVQETYVIPTDEPTEVPTATPTSEPTATPLPTATPTLEPTPTAIPTEIPMYIGLSADEVDALRADCLEQNPDSLCLPLPVDPTSATLQWEAQPLKVEQLFLDGEVASMDQVNAAMHAAVASDPNLDFDSWSDAHVRFEEVLTDNSLLKIFVYDGVMVTSPWDSLVQYSLYDVEYVNPRPDHTGNIEFSWFIGGLQEISMWEVTIKRPNWTPIFDEDFHIFGGQSHKSWLYALNRSIEGEKDVEAGEVVVTAAGELVVEITNSSILRSPLAGDPNDAYREGVFEYDLLHTPEGSTVYVLPSP